MSREQLEKLKEYIRCVASEEAEKSANRDTLSESVATRRAEKELEWIFGL